jgi:hypothetical protein
MIDAATPSDAIDRNVAMLRNLAASLGERKTIQLGAHPPDDQHLLWFDQGTTRHQPARATLGIGDAERRVALGAIKLRWTLSQDGRFNAQVALGDAGRAIARLWADRLEAGGGDRTWSPLAPAYLRRKQRLGQPPHPGVATGAMVRWLRGCFVIVRNA